VVRQSAGRQFQNRTDIPPQQRSGGTKTKESESTREKKEKKETEKDGEKQKRERRKKKEKKKHNGKKRIDCREGALSKRSLID